MKLIEKQNKVPTHSIILKKGQFGKLNYSDAYRVIVKPGKPVDAILNQVFKSPRWAEVLMTLRDSIVKNFGLKTGNATAVKNYYEVGDKAYIFTVTDRNETEIVMAEDDKHLNFRTSVSIIQAHPDCEVYLTTIVHYNNFFGRVYFFFVKPFHRRIMKECMRNLL